MCFVFFFKQRTAYDMRISDWSSDVCSSDLARKVRPDRPPHSLVDTADDATPRLLIDWPVSNRAVFADWTSTQRGDVMEAVLAFGLLIALILGGMWIQFAVSISGLLYIFLLKGFVGWKSLGMFSWGAANSFTLAAITLFVQ